MAGLWEATYVYDIGCRIRRNLEQHTRATVWMTRKDGDLGFQVPDRGHPDEDRNQYLLTHPQYRLQEHGPGGPPPVVSDQRHHPQPSRAAKVPRSKTVFLSVHADSLHPSVRGAMGRRALQVSSAQQLHRATSGHQGVCGVQGHPTVRLGAEYKARVEASSRHMAGKIVASLDRNGLAVHDDDPVRGRILRGRRSWVPAVLRYTAAQNALLLESLQPREPLGSGAVGGRRLAGELLAGGGRRDGRGVQYPEVTRHPTICELRITNCRLQITNYKLQIADCGFPRPPGS